jgi:hypothetical protein
MPIPNSEGRQNRAVSPFSSGAIPLPNAVIDELMPCLKDTELRVLLVVLRQTLGWREGDDLGGWRFKRRDWISHSQLCRRSGRSGDAVSAAVDALVRRRLIIVENEAGMAMDSPGERRRALGRLYFRPGDMWITSENPHPVKAETTTDKRYNKRKVTESVCGGGWQRAGYPPPPLRSD